MGGAGTRTGREPSGNGRHALWAVRRPARSPGEHALAIEPEIAVDVEEPAAGLEDSPGPVRRCAPRVSRARDSLVR
jgi:hypothetical protein